MDWIIKWLRRATLYRFKIGLLAFLSTAFLLNIRIDVNIKNWSASYYNGSTSNLVLVTIVGICLLMIGLDFWLERIKSKERTQKEMLKALRDSNVPNSIKTEIMEFLREDQ